MTNSSTRSPLANLQRRSGLRVGSAASPTNLRALSEADRLTISEVLSQEQDYIDSDEFRVSDAEHRIYKEAPEIRKPDASWYGPVMNDLGLAKNRLPRVSDQVILTGAEERVIFLQYNYARYRVATIREEILSTPDQIPTDAQARDLLRWYRKSRIIREQIAETNLALVLAMAKRTRMSEVDFADLVSEGNMALLRAVDKFDAGRGFKFSTYACRAIIKAFSRQGMKLSKHRQRFPTDFDPKLERSDYVESRREEFLSDSASEVKRIVIENRADLSDIEKTVIEHRFRLEDEYASHSKPMTLEQVGQIIGVTKERVRQIQNKALEKIRIELEESFIEGRPTRTRRDSMIEPSMN